ncbi:MAG TPA: imidazole glycerol phosphate synthase subunit HisH [Planctomycetaceae bacterium]|nr:imidazole glycerol phosphate synthase subunit HisH [Planctomycetaceae bacterium]
MIQIVDYGMGNLRSVQKAFERLSVPAAICTRPEQLDDCEKLVLPGVGAFRDAISELRRQEFVEPIKRHIASEKPFLGICLGLQLLFDVSYEDGTWEGLGIVPGEVVRFPDAADLKVPHMGWNKVAAPEGCPLLAGMPRDPFFYFVHSYYGVPRDESVVVGRTEYGRPFSSLIQRGRLYATQFHPEKSQQFGLQLLKNFAQLSA